MPYDEEEPPYVEPDVEMNELTGRAIAAAYEVYGELGPGLDESIYREAMCRELSLRDIAIQTEVWIDVQYKARLLVASGSIC